MSEIKITCKCGKKITVNIKTIDELKKKIKWLKNDNRRLTAQVAALKTMDNFVISRFFR